MKNQSFIWAQSHSWTQVSALGLVMQIGKFGCMGDDEEVWYEGISSDLGIPKRYKQYGTKLLIITGLSESYPIHMIDDLAVGYIG